MANEYRPSGSYGTRGSPALGSADSLPSLSDRVRRLTALGRAEAKPASVATLSVEQRLCVLEYASRLQDQRLERLEARLTAALTQVGERLAK